jgi:hypothetical protein
MVNNSRLLSHGLRFGGFRGLGLATGKQAGTKQKEGEWSACHTVTVKHLRIGVGND